jgi:hypothetical protein
MSDFFRRYSVVVSCIVFLGLSLALRAMNSLAPGRVDPVGVLLLEVMHPLQIGMTAVSRGASHLWEDYIALWSLREQNADLRRRLADLEDFSRQALELHGPREQLPHGWWAGAQVLSFAQLSSTKAKPMG